MTSLLAVFTVRIMPFLLWGRPGLTTGDVVNHLNLIDSYRANRHRRPDFSSKFLLSDPENYPTLFHQFLAYLPQRVVDRLEPAVGSVVETIHAGLIFCVTCYFASSLWGFANPEHVAAAAVLLFATTPLLIENPGRVYRMSPRPASAMLTGTSMLLLTMYLSSGESRWLLAASLLGAAVALLSKFGVQAILFFTGFLSIFTLDARPLLLPMFAFLFATLLSRGHYLRVLYGHVHHSWFYCTYLRDKIYYTTAYTYTQLVKWPLTLYRAPRLALRLLVQHFLLVGFTFVPWVFLLAATYWVRPEWMFGSAERWLVLWYGAAVATMFVTAAPWFRFLGEAFRYVEYSIPAVCILTAARMFALNDPGLWMFAAVLLVANLIGIAGSYFVAKFVTREDGDRAALYNWVAQQPASTLLTIDLRLSFLLCFRTPHRSVQVHTNAPSGKNLAAFKKLIPRRYPLPNNDLESLVETYGIDLVVVCDKTVAAIQQKDPEYVYELDSYDEVFKQGRFRVLKPRYQSFQQRAA
ncbi:MAG: hypothetical protein AB7O26_00255 [Planctomycetaceae bacterium]